MAEQVKTTEVKKTTTARKPRTTTTTKKETKAEIYRDVLKAKLLKVFEEIQKSEHKLLLDEKTYTKVSTRRKVLRTEFGLDVKIITILRFFEPNYCVFEAQISFLDRDTGLWDLVATGHATENRSTSEINRVSFLENCETSAVGRALDNLGINGGDLPSDAELAKQSKRGDALNSVVVKTKKETKQVKSLVSEDTLKNIMALLKESNLEQKQILSQYNVSKMEELTADNAKEIISLLSEDVPL